MKHRLASVLISLILPALLQAAEPRPLTFQDVMAFRAIRNTIISNHGKWVAYQAEPDRGDGELIIQQSDGTANYRLPLASNAIFSDDGRWLAARVNESLVDSENRKEGEKAPTPGVVLLDLSNGGQLEFESIRSFAFSSNSSHLGMLRVTEEETSPTEEKGPGVQGSSSQKEESEQPLDHLVLHSLSEVGSRDIAGVKAFAFDPSTSRLALIGRGPGATRSGVLVKDLGNPGNETRLRAEEGEEYNQLTWSKEGSRLGFLSTVGEEKEEIARSGRLWVWDGSGSALEIGAQELQSGWFIPFKNRLTWSPQSSRLFFGLKPDSEVTDLRASGDSEQEEVATDPTDLEAILDDREVDVWHWNDDAINPQQKIGWDSTRDRTYLAVYDTTRMKVVQLADQALTQVRPGDAGEFLLGLDDRAYRVRTTWDENYNDLYRVNPADGSRKKLIEGLVGNELATSPEGRFLAYFRDENWHLLNLASGETRNLTAQLPVPFADEDHDFPSHRPGYRVAGWLKDESAVLIYDKYDIWSFSTADGQARNLTGGEGRRNNTVFRWENLEPEDHPYLEAGRQMLLTGYRDLEKSFGFYRMNLGEVGIRPLLTGPKRYRVVAKAKDSDRIVFTQETYQEFPDLLVSDSSFGSPRKISDVNPQINDFLWGAAELVSWNSLDGRPHQGVLIKPGNYQPGRRYPVLVYFYRFFSQRLHEFNQPVINHRPSFPFYTSNGYAIFLPDIRFEVGRPGLASTKSLVPGVQKLIDMGVADPRAIGLHGHSWSGYQTAHIITQTDMFAAAVAGAPVSNMTSAYGGIRWGSGRARQFQYEKTQSRLGVSLWENPIPFIENSPLFYADRIETPLLIQFGDEDGAVPWYQGIELYLAMRRLGKDCVFLQYRGEPHHLQKYPNKLDYAMKMKEYFDHYLRGFPAPEWISKGVPYRGR